MTFELLAPVASLHPTLRGARITAAGPPRYPSPKLGPPARQLIEAAALFTQTDGHRLFRSHHGAPFERSSTPCDLSRCGPPGIGSVLLESPPGGAAKTL